MNPAISLDEYLKIEVGTSELLRAVADTVLALVAAAEPVADLIALGALAGEMARVRSEHAVGGDAQKELDAITNTQFIDALREAPVAYVLSEEEALPLSLKPEAPLAVALDPLDGSSNIDSNCSIGTIFSILPAIHQRADAASASFLQAGRAQLAAGFIVYGPQVSLALSLGAGTSRFVLDRRSKRFMLVARKFRVADRSNEFAINASNQRHWDSSIRAYVDDCMRGDAGPRSENFNMRWIGSMVADAWRILVRGGIYLYPGDDRVGYRHGRLRLIYEANPIALLMEQAGGAATDGEQRILDLVPESEHQRTPLVFGSAAEVARVARYYTELGHDAERSPLFRERGLLRA